MPELHADADPVALEEAVRRMAVTLGSVLGSGARHSGMIGPVLHLQIPIDAVEPLAWLQSQSHMTQYYWADRENTFEMAGAGEADIVAPNGGEADSQSPFRTIRRRLPMYPRGPRYYGGFRFRPGPARGEYWRAFRDYRFVLPRFEIVRRGGRCFFAVNALAGHAGANRQTLEAALDGLNRLRPPAPAVIPEAPRVHSRVDLPDKAAWTALIKKTLHAFETTPLEKVVLARETCFETDGALDSVALLRRLVQHTERSFDFCFHPAPDRAFIGASPERLYRRAQSYVQSEAVAATRRRGVTGEEDACLGEELLNDEKSRREHQYVVNMLRETLGGLCRAVHGDAEPTLLRLRNCQHLYLPVEGFLNEPWDDAALIAALHPTPAVGGTPRDHALRWISDKERFDRGIYASPVGWVGPDSAEFCVAIRSGLVQKDRLVLYNGAGIVAGSDPDEEWAELENKMENFLQVLSGHD